MIKNMIKNIKPSKNSNFKQGYYNLENPDKYIGVLPIIFRSSWERKFMIWADRNVNVINWASENIMIEYVWRMDNKKHKYYPDFFIKVLDNNGLIKNTIIEVKPQLHLIKPIQPKINTKKSVLNYKYLVEQYTKNLDKYIAANNYCLNKNWDFKILTEKTINTL